MRIVESPREMQAVAREWRGAGETIGFVPTMGALHRGHIELCRRARSENDRFSASIFVNPLQFRAGEDLDKYPRPFERDLQILEEAGCDALFYPSRDAMYGKPGESKTLVDVFDLDSRWEGASRPGHFRGVATVVAKLFNVALPHRAYFGEKDFQQLTIIERMVIDLNFDLQVIPCPTVRESDGLALSSRNTYLSAEQRQAAPVLYRTLQIGREAAAAGQSGVEELLRLMNQELASVPDIRPDYLAVVEADSLEPALVLEKGKDYRIILAAYAGNTRLIDNVGMALN